MKLQILLALGLFYGALPALAEPKPPQWQTRVEYSMGSLWQITVLAAEAQAKPALDQAFAAIRHWDEVLSDYRSESELNQVQPRAWQDWTPISPDLAQALEQSQRYAELSQGAFDLTLRPLVALWGFKTRQPYRPTRTELANARQLTGMQRIQLQGLKLKLEPGTELDFGAIGKGIAVDAAVNQLRQQGIQIGLVDALSSQYYLGSPPGQTGWHVQIRDPRHQDQTLAGFEVHDAAVASSGDDQQSFEIEGLRYGHILDPQTGQPAQGPASVTVVGASASETDALSTAFTLLPWQQVKQLAAARGLRVWRYWDQGPQSQQLRLEQSP